METKDDQTVSKPENVEPQKTSESKEEYVARKAYEEVSHDMHKYKNKLKAEAARANELEAKMKAFEEQKLVEKEEYKTLYEKEKEAKSEIEAKLKENDSVVRRAVKVAALKVELGNVKDDYLSFADLDGIELNESGGVNSETVHAVANKFRKDHPTLITKSDSNVNITGNAPNTNLEPNKPQTLSDLSTEQKIELLADLKSKRS